MFLLGVKGKFEAAHSLRNYSAECSRIHGHRWEAEIIVEIKELDETGMGIDFKILKKILNEVLSPFDHQYLNEVFPFDNINPTAENLAFEIWRRFEEATSKVPVKLKEVKLWEGENSWACYVKQGQALPANLTAGLPSAEH